MTAFDILFTKLSTDPVSRGREFERICKWLLQTSPEYKPIVRRVWLWAEWPGRWGPDAGIDLVVETTQGTLWAVQAKAYAPDYTVRKADVDTFLSESSRPCFHYRLLIATTNRLAPRAQRTIDAQEKPVGTLLLAKLREAVPKWPDTPDVLWVPKLPQVLPLPHQCEAIRAVGRGLDNHDRGQLIMACGTGKTLTSLWIAEDRNARRILVLAPSLSLLGQTIRTWTRHSRSRFVYLPVCSDDTVDSHDSVVSHTRDLGFPVTTSPSRIAEFLKGNGVRVVFATYQSSPAIRDAFTLARLKPFDLAIADEAHRCAGQNGSAFSIPLHDKYIPARKRVFMTATPRFFTERVRKVACSYGTELVSMDDAKLFGPTLHELSFAESIQRGLLSDYQVLVIGVDHKGYRRDVKNRRFVTQDGFSCSDARTLAIQIAIAKAMRQYDLRRVISFHGRVDRARDFSETLPRVVDRLRKAERPNGTFWSKHASGAMPAGHREAILDRLRAVGNGEAALLSNARCLSEGVDIPALDGIAFVDPKGSTVDIIQAVGRVIRKANHKKVGIIIVPIFVESHDDPDTTLSRSEFQAVWQIIRALRAHDSRLAEQLDEIRERIAYSGPRSGSVGLPDAIRVDLPKHIGPEFSRAFYLRALEKTTARPPLTIELILKWADAHYVRSKEWPTTISGQVLDAPGESWDMIDVALRAGNRGLPGGSSLPKLLSQSRGFRNPKGLPKLSEEVILAAADSYFQRMGKWPTNLAGEIPELPGETWSGVRRALIKGGRGLPGGSSLCKLLEEHRGVRNPKAMPTLSEAQILKWADAYRRKTGQWPIRKSGPIKGSQGDTWGTVDGALITGTRGLPGHCSLAQLLEKYRGVPNKQNMPPLRIRAILRAMDQYRAENGRWPKRESGPVVGIQGHTWAGIEGALRAGVRGLPGGLSLARLAERYRNTRNRKNLPHFTIRQILRWADEYRARHGIWPNSKSGPIENAPGETWGAVQIALTCGRRGLHQKSSLAKVLAQHRGVRNRGAVPVLSCAQILTWADAHFKRTGTWPNANSGPIPGTCGETWKAVSLALFRGRRGVEKSTTLPRLLYDHRGVRSRLDKPRHSRKKIITWARLHERRTGKLPTVNSGSVIDAPGENWRSIDAALRVGTRGLKGGSSLVKLIRPSYQRYGT